KWGEFQKRRPTTTEVKRWFGNGAKHNVAVVCGSISNNLVVLDCDTEDRFYELAGIICDKLDIDDILEFARVSKTGKGYHIWLFVKESVQSHKFPKLDIKAEGGYVVAPPSLHPGGNYYEFVNPLVPIKHIDSLLDIGIDLAQRKEKETLRQTDNWITKALLGVGEGDRNDICYRLACYFRNSHPIDITETLMLNWNKRNSPPLDDTEVLRTIKSAYGRVPHGENVLPPLGRGGDIYVSKRHNSATNATENATENATMPQSLAGRIEEWIAGTVGWFETGELDRELGISTVANKNNRRNTLLRLEQRGTIERHPKQNKAWRFVNRELEELNYKNIQGSLPLPVTMPLGLTNLVNLYAGNLVVIAGTTNAGKTALALEITRLNNGGEMPVYYFYSEGGAKELRDRLDKCEGMAIEEWNFRLFSRSTNFSDVIAPDCLNVVDYLELVGDFWEVNKHLTAICNRIGNGLAVVCI
ncbi:hypothetical protein GW916_15885, partial [bacterium]|nr:hypothetical protein [bacterium]